LNVEQQVRISPENHRESGPFDTRRFCPSCEYSIGHSTSFRLDQVFGPRPDILHVLGNAEKYQYGCRTVLQHAAARCQEKNLGEGLPESRKSCLGAGEPPIASARPCLPPLHGQVPKSPLEFRSHKIWPARPVPNRIIAARVCEHDVLFRRLVPDKIAHQFERNARRFKRPRILILTVYLRRKKTFGATWEQILPTIQPWLVRWSGLCPFCGTKFEGIFENTT
jgi:hypothetical protein